MIPIRGEVTGARAVASALQQIPSLVQQAGEAAMRETLELISKTLRTDFLEGPYPEEIQSRTGSFRATFRRGHPQNIFEVRSHGTTLTGIYGSQDTRGHILNDGGIIRPKTAQYLAVRTEFTKTAGGVVKAKYRAPLRTVPHTFVRMGKLKGSRGARGTVFEKIGSRIIPIAWLVKYVLIKGRHFIQKTMAKVEPQVPEIFSRRMGQVIDRLNRTFHQLR